MTTHRVTDRTRFVVVDQRSVRDDRLSFKALGLLTWLLDKPDDWRCDAAAIARERSDGRRAILSGLKELENAGYLERHRRQDELKRWTSSTDIHEIAEVLLCDVGSCDVGEPHPLEVPRPTTETAAAAAEQSSDQVMQVPLALPVVPPSPAELALDACMEAAMRAGELARAGGKRISDLRAWAKPKATETLLPLHEPRLLELIAGGASPAELVAHIESSADPFVRSPVRPEPVRPALPEFSQGAFEEPGPIDFLAAREKRVADAPSADPRAGLAMARRVARGER